MRRPHSVLPFSPVGSRNRFPGPGSKLPSAPPETRNGTCPHKSGPLAQTIVASFPEFGTQIKVPEHRVPFASFEQSLG